MQPIPLEQMVALGLETGAAADLRKRLASLSGLSPPEAWRRVTADILKPDHPFPLHQLVFAAVYAEWDTASRGPAPAWFPSESRIREANLTRLMPETGTPTYDRFYTWSIRNRAEFWATMIRVLGIRLEKESAGYPDLSRPEDPRWLPGATLNIAESCFQAPENAPAVVFAGESDPESVSRMSYGELRDLSNRVANGLCRWGLEPGDAVAVDLPMNVSSVAIYLGCVLAGCVVVSIADSFAPHEIATRLRIAKTKAVFTQDFLLRGGKRIPLYAKVMEAGAPRTVVLSAPSADSPSVDLRQGDLSWEEFLDDSIHFTAVPRSPEAATNILFSSGTTGDPKAIPWTQTTPIKCAADGFLHHDIQPGNVVAWPTNLGWMMGPWLIYAALVNRGTIALFDGIPTGREFGRFIQAAEVTMLGVVPALVRAWKTSRVMSGLDWSAIKTFSSTGEASNAEDMLFLMTMAGYRPIIEYCGGTEIGGGYVTGTVIQPAAPSTFTTPALGLELAILDERGSPAPKGEVFLVPPSIGLSTRLLNMDHHAVYFDGTPQHTRSIPLRRHGDQLERLPGGFYRIHGRVDDTMNLGGIKVSSAEIERVLNAVDGIQESAAIAVSRPSKLVVFVVPERETGSVGDGLKTSMQSAIRDQLNPLFRIHDAVIVEALPRTASNKIMRRVLRDQYET